MPLDGREPGRHFVAEGDWDGLLQIAASCHRCIVVAAGEIGQVARDGCQVILDERERLPDLHDCGGIRDVLGGCSPVAILSQMIRTCGHQLLHHWQDRIADQLRLALELHHVDDVEGAFGGDFIGSPLWDEAQAGLHARQRCLDIEVALHPILV